MASKSLASPSFSRYAQDQRVGIYSNRDDMVAHFPSSPLLGAIWDDPRFDELAKITSNHDEDPSAFRVTYYPSANGGYIRNKNLDVVFENERLMHLNTLLAGAMAAMTGRAFVHCEVTSPRSNSNKHWDLGIQTNRMNGVIPLDFGIAGHIIKALSWIVTPDVTSEQIVAMKDNPSLDPRDLGLEVAEAPSNRPFFFKKGQISSVSAQEQMISHNTNHTDTLFHWAQGYRYALVCS